MDKIIKDKFKKRHSVIPSVHLFLIKNNKILLLKRCKTGFMDGHYSVPAGHIEKNETALMSLIREVKEEIDINISFKNIMLIEMMHRKETHEERVDFFFTVNNWSGKIKNMEPQKCDNLKWFNLNSLPINLVPYIKAAIDAFKTNMLYTEFGWEK